MGVHYTVLAMISLQKKDWVGMCMGACFGALVFFVFYGRTLAFTDVAWIAGDGWDTFQHLIGWELYRRAEWVFPIIGQNLNFGYPIGVPIIYTDSIPLLAIPFKLFSRWLPEQFQYFGLWTLLTFMLQGVFGYLMAKSFTKKTWSAILASAFFVLSPIMHQRVGGHGALGTHWLILWPLWLMLREHQFLAKWSWTALFAAVTLVHPYLFFIVAALFAAELCSVLYIKKSITWRSLIIYLLPLVSMVLALAYVIGMFYVGDAGSGGFGLFSMNINALVNSNGWRSPLLPPFHWLQYQFEGFQYLGVGAIGMAVLSLIALIRKGNFRALLAAYWPLGIVCVVLTALALSNTVAFGSRVLIDIDLPKRVENILSIIRSSGRMFWPVYYIILLGSFYWLRFVTRRAAVVGLALFLVIQIYDFYPMLAFKKSLYDSHTYGKVLTSEFWPMVKGEYQHIAFVPDYVVDDGYMPVALYGAYNNMTINSGYFARPIKGNGRHVREMAKQVESGSVSSDTLYIVTSQSQKYTAHIDTKKHAVKTIDGYTVIAPDFFDRHPGIQTTE